MSSAFAEVSLLKIAADAGQIIGACATAVAAWLAWRTAGIAARSLNEMRASRLEPVISFGTTEPSFNWKWSLKDDFPTWSGGFYREAPDADGAPAFEIANFGGAAAIGLTIEFAIGDVPSRQDADLALVEGLGYSLTWNETYANKSSKSGGHQILYRRAASVLINHCGSNERVRVLLPPQIGVWLFVSQIGNLKIADEFDSLTATRDVVVTADIHFEKPDGRFGSQSYLITFRSSGGWLDKWEDGRKTRLNVRSDVEVRRSMKNERREA